MHHAHKHFRLPPYAAFLLFNAFFFMTDTMGSYFQIYLNDIGLSKGMIGFISGTASLAALVVQPIFGAWTDRAQSKTRVLQLMLLATALLYPLVLANNQWWYILVVFSAYSMFRYFQHPLNTSMSVEFSERSGLPYGPIRMMGSIGYAVVMYFIGWVSEQEGGTKGTFYIFSLVCLISTAVLCLMPRIEGHNRCAETGKSAVSQKVLRKNKQLMILTVFQTLMAVCYGLTFNYFGIFFTDDIGGSKQLFGTMLSIGAFLELPVLFLADRIIRRVGERKLLFALGMINCLRWLISSMATSTTTLFVVYMGNVAGALEIVTYSLALSRMVQPQLKTSAQALASTVQSVASILICSYLGGFLGDALGIRSLYLIAGLTAGIVSVVFCGFLLKFDDKPANAC